MQNALMMEDKKNFEIKLKNLLINKELALEIFKLRHKNQKN